MNDLPGSIKKRGGGQHGREEEGNQEGRKEGSQEGHEEEEEVTNFFWIQLFCAGVPIEPRRSCFRNTAQVSRDFGSSTMPLLLSAAAQLGCAITPAWPESC